MIEIKRDARLGPGSWRDMFAERRMAIVACPKCGQTYSLRGHTIADDGTVSPSLVCPAKACDFHEHVRLMDWAA